MKALARAWARLVCRVRGHDFRAPVITANTLCFCSRGCGKEIADRTFADIGPLTDDEREMLERWGDALLD